MKGKPQAMTTSKTTSGARNTAILYACVAAGGVVGSVARYFASVVIPSTFGFPWATLFVNITGSFIIGFYSTLTGPDGRLFAGTRQRQFVMTGICGGYTTFSAFSLETVRLLQSGRAPTALIYMAASVVTWLVAVWLGHTLASRANRLKGS
jgi:fluoride exporter